MAVTAKFKIARVTPYGEAGTEIEFTPDYAQGRNAEWAKATPAGVMRLTISNPAALDALLGEDLKDHHGPIMGLEIPAVTVTLERE